MFEVNIAVMLVLCLIVLIAMGVHIAISLGMTSALGIFFTTKRNFVYPTIFSAILMSVINNYF